LYFPTCVPLFPTPTSRYLRLTFILGTELAGVFQVDVPFLLQQAQFLYEKQLEELQLQMQRVNSSTSVLGQSKGTYIISCCILCRFVNMQIPENRHEQVDYLKRLLFKDLPLDYDQLPPH